MTENKAIPQNFAVVLLILQKLTSINVAPYQAQLSLTFGCDWSHAPYQSQLSLTSDCDWSHAAFIKVNFSKLTQKNQILRNYFVFTHYDLCKISANITECKMFATYELSITQDYLWIK